LAITGSVDNIIVVERAATEGVQALWLWATSLDGPFGPRACFGSKMTRSWDAPMLVYVRKSHSFHSNSSNR